MNKGLDALKTSIHYRKAEVQKLKSYIISLTLAAHTGRRTFRSARFDTLSQQRRVQPLALATLVTMSEPLPVFKNTPKSIIL